MASKIEQMDFFNVRCADFICLLLLSILLIQSNSFDNSEKQYIPQQYSSCSLLPARLPNKTKTSQPMQTCFEVHSSNNVVLNILKSKEEFIANKFSKYQRSYSNAVKLMKALYEKTSSTTNHTDNHINKLNFLIIGDSMSKQSYFSFCCDLEYFGAIPQTLNENDTARSFIKNHIYYKNLKTPGLMYNIENDHFENKYMLSMINNDGIKIKLFIHLIFIWRALPSSGPGIIGDIGLSTQAKIPFKDLLTTFLGKKTIVLYNEGHHHKSEHSLLTALKYPIKLFQELSNKEEGPYFMIRESNALHFQTLRNIPEEDIGLFKSANLSAELCVRTKKNSKLWMNNALRLSLLDINETMKIDYISFYASTAIWEFDLHRFPDCLHPTCYTPFYWIPLFDTIYQVFMNNITINWNLLVEEWDPNLNIDNLGLFKTTNTVIKSDETYPIVSKHQSYNNHHKNIIHNSNINNNLHDGNNGIVKKNYNNNNKKNYNDNNIINIKNHKLSQYYTKKYEKYDRSKINYNKNL